MNEIKLPSHWKILPLGEVIHSTQYGLSTRGSQQGQYPILRMNSLIDGKVSNSDLQYVDLIQKDFLKFRLNNDDLLFNRTNSFDLVGKTGLFALEGDYVFASYLIRVVPNTDSVIAAYLNYYLNWDVSQANLKKLASRGVSQSNINATKLAGFLVPIPPLPEQSAIAHTLRTIQKAKEARQRELELERERKAALMQYLFTHGTRNEPSKKTELGDIPESWQVVRLDSIAEMASGGTPSKNRSDWWQGKIPWVSTKDLKQPRLWDTQDHISEEGLQNGSRLVPANTLFVAVRGMCLAKDIPVAMAEVPMAFNQDIKALMPLSNVDAEYLLYTFQYQKADILQFVGTSAHGTKRLGTSSLQALPILLPPIEEQQLISEALRACDRKITALEQEAAFLAELFRAMLEELMTGRLSALPLVEEKALH